MRTNAQLDTKNIAELAARYPEVFKTSVFWRFLVASLSIAPFLLIGVGLWWLGFSFTNLIAGIDRLSIVLALMVPPSPGPLFQVYLKGLMETLSIAFLGTLLASFLAFPLGFFAAKNVVANRILHFVARRFLDSVRGVDTLIWALIFINVVGLGPFAGVLAVAMSDMASLGKLFSEAIKSADRKPVEGVIATGASQLQALRFGLLPQVLPVMISQILYYFESNTRSATVIGIVGAGGIGLYLSNEINQLNWDRVAFIILMILVIVGLIDWVSSRARAAIAGPVQPL
jgi:phosphonate transport system permease protein